MKLFLLALEYASLMHRNQKRKYTNEPYINHPISVSRLVSCYSDDETDIMAAILHDVIEDTEATYEDIFKLFGRTVAEKVNQLTDISKPSDGNRKERKKIDRLHMEKSFPSVKTIKLADLLDNTSTIVIHDPSFAKVYMAEIKLLLDVLKEGNSKLYTIVNSVVEDYYNSI